jgi:hypothetical protein
MDIEVYKMNPVHKILYDVSKSRTYKCHKGLKWPEENIQSSNEKKICENCVYQFNCKKSDYQPVKRGK